MFYHELEMIMNVLPSECDCQKCSMMCRAPCCGTPEDMISLMHEGYASRLMLDDYPGAPDMIKPALKGFEGDTAPWEVASEEGCTFWSEGKCELHNLGLKPLQGKLALHGATVEEKDYISKLVCDSWEGEKAKEAIDLWRSLNTQEPKLCIS